MGRRFSIFIAVLALSLVALGLVACTENASARRRKSSSHDGLDINAKSTESPKAGASEVDVSTPPEIIPVEVDYASYIPDIEFGKPLFAFKNDDDNGKTFLYGDVEYDDVENYAHDLILSGFVLEKHECSKENDTYRAEFYNEKEDVYADLKYATTGLTVIVYSPEN